MRSVCGRISEYGTVVYKKDFWFISHLQPDDKDPTSLLKINDKAFLEDF
jgi:hypothetical protein